MSGHGYLRPFLGKQVIKKYLPEGFTVVGFCKIVWAGLKFSGFRNLGVTEVPVLVSRATQSSGYTFQRATTARNLGHKQTAARKPLSRQGIEI